MSAAVETTGAPLRVAAHGARLMAPMTLAYAPFALTIGAEIARHPDPVASWAGTLLIYGGSAQLAVVQLTGSGAVLVAVATGLLVHSRLFVYGLSVAPHWRTERSWFQVIAAATLIDPTWAVAMERFSAGGDRSRAQAAHLGAVGALTVGWVAMVTAGVVIGPTVTTGTGLELAAPLCVLTLVVPRATDRPGLAAALVGATVGVAAAGFPAGTGLLLAIAAGTAAGTLAGRAEP